MKYPALRDTSYLTLRYREVALRWRKKRNTARDRAMRHILQKPLPKTCALVQKILQPFVTANIPAVIFGGFLRDKFFLGKSPDDIDVMVYASEKNVAACLGVEPREKIPVAKFYGRALCGELNQTFLHRYAVAGVPYEVEVCGSKKAFEPEDIPPLCDFGVCQIAATSNTLYYTPAFVEDIRERRLALRDKRPTRNRMRSAKRALALNRRLGLTPNAELHALMQKYNQQATA